MDGGGSNCIEEGLQIGRRKVSIRGNMKEKVGVFFSGMQSFLVFVAFRLFSYLLMNFVAPMT
jgi:hypothetical protein